MKLIINYDFIEAVYNAKEKFSLSKSWHNNAMKHLDIVPLVLVICAISGSDINATMLSATASYGIFSSMDLLTDFLAYKVTGDDIYELKASEKLKKLVKKLEDLNIRTDYDSLLQSELYEKHYKVEVNEGILPKLVEEKYVLVPGRIFRGEMEDISVLQEHVVGREEYVLSLGSPSKKTSRRLVNSFS